MGKEREQGEVMVYCKRCIHPPLSCVYFMQFKLATFQYISLDVFAQAFVNSQAALANRLNFGAIICWPCTIAAWTDGDPETLLCCWFHMQLHFLCSHIMYCALKKQAHTEVCTVEQPLSVGLDVICEYWHRQKRLFTGK